MMNAAKATSVAAVTTKEALTMFIAYRLEPPRRYEFEKLKPGADLVACQGRVASRSPTSRTGPTCELADEAVVDTVQIW